jgi:Ca-activated chloride channel family protein
MNPADFQHPEILALRPALVALALLHLALALQQWWWQRRQFNAAALRRFGPGLSLWRGLLKTGLWAAAGWFLLNALAVPLGPPIKVEAPQSGADVVLCVDVSSSMLCMDENPNRLGAVKAGLQGLLDHLDGDRVGIIAFAGDAVMACPLTNDMDTASLFLEKLDIDSVPHDGTGLAPALDLARDGFPKDPLRGRLIVLATDGEDNAGSDVLDAARKCKDEGMPVFCLGVGSKEGALVPGRKDAFGRVYAKMWHGQPAKSIPDKAGLRRIAEAGGGEYADGGSNAALARAAERVRQLKQGLAKQPDRYVREPLYEIPLLWAVALLLIEGLLSARGGGSLRAGRGLWKGWLGLLRRRKAAAGLCLALGLAAGLRAQVWDSGRSPYNQGNQAYRQGDYGAAADAYKQSQAAAPDQESAPYNLGNALFKQGDYQGAVQAYQDALKLAPQDADAQYNLDLAQRMLDQKKNQKDKKGGKKDGDKKGGQGNQGQQQGGQGQQQGGQNGQSRGQNGQGQPKPGQGGQTKLSQDQVQAMMNQLRLDQKRYAGAFSPMKHYPRADQQPQDPMQAMMNQMMGLPPPPQAPPQKGPNGQDLKDW